jgi:hypothetical protein
MKKSTFEEKADRIQKLIVSSVKTPIFQIFFKDGSKSIDIFLDGRVLVKPDDILGGDVFVNNSFHNLLCTLCGEIVVLSKEIDLLKEGAI